MKTSEINIRDPFILVFKGIYYMYGTRGASCWGSADGFDCYQSKDLVEWSEPVEVFHAPADFWADRNFWAPEVYSYEGSFYMFASFKSEEACRGTQVLKANSPLGPFEIHSEGPVTPRTWECLDGTFYVEEDQPYMVFSHEWVQVKDGEICAIPLSKDLKKAVGEPVLLFHASEAQWSAEFRDNNHVTDGPFLFSKDGKLFMLWSSIGKDGYAMGIAESKSGKVCGPWIQRNEPMYSKDGGHGMLFCDIEGRLLLTLHSPNETPKERPVFLQISEIDM